MNYKSVIKSRRTRLKILRLLRFLPDRTMLKLQYRIKFGRKLNLVNPKRFTEKLQWYKLSYKNPLMITCVDKYDVREYVANKGLSDILIPCCGVFDSSDQIDWSCLPEQFVMKDTLGGGGNSVVIVKDKKDADFDELSSAGNKWANINNRIKGGGREWPYYSGKRHRIIIEKFIFDSINKDLIDYKFFCFNGKVKFLYVMGNRKAGQSVSCAILDENFNSLDVRNAGHEVYADFKKPDNFDRMKCIAEQLSEEFPHVRVDLYSVEEKIFFGEMTFFSASGYMTYDPDDFDYEAGNFFDLKKFLSSN